MAGFSSRFSRVSRVFLGLFYLFFLGFRGLSNSLTNKGCNFFEAETASCLSIFFFFVRKSKQLKP